MNEERPPPLPLPVAAPSWTEKVTTRFFLGGVKGNSGGVGCFWLCARECVWLGFAAEKTASTTTGRCSQPQRRSNRLVVFSPC